MKKPVKSPNKTEVRNVRLDSDLQQRLDSVADKMDLPAATIIRLAVKALVEAFEENESLPMPLKVKFITMEERIQHLEEKRKAG